jgi:hypothetical protein
MSDYAYHAQLERISASLQGIDVSLKTIAALLQPQTIEQPLGRVQHEVDEPSHFSRMGP